MGVKGYKAFNKGMICKDKVYKENTTYEETGNEICKPGVMHFCENPFDVLNYYPLVDSNGEICEFADVEAIGKLYKSKGGDKCATNKLKVGAKLNLKGFVKACIDFANKKTLLETNKFFGYGAKLASSGDGTKLASSGYYAQLASSGYGAQLATTGECSVVAAVGINSIAKARVGSWITLAEWVDTGNEDEEGNYIWFPKCVKTEYVDGEKIKEDVFYKLIDGEFKEVTKTEE